MTALIGSAKTFFRPSQIVFAILTMPLSPELIPSPNVLNAPVTASHTVCAVFLMSFQNRDQAAETIPEMVFKIVLIVFSASFHNARIRSQTALAESFSPVQKPFQAATTTLEIMSQ